MSDLNNVNTEVTDALAAGLEGSGMSRRERRELALRLADHQVDTDRLRRVVQQREQIGKLGFETPKQR